MATLTAITDFTWNILGSLTVITDFLWRVGGSKLEWYVVTSDPSFCNGEIESTTEVVVKQTFLASSLEELASQLKKTRWSGTIKSVQKWTRPALECDIRKEEKNGVDHCCNYLVDIDFCIPELYSYLTDCTLDIRAGLTWYSEYTNVNPTVTAGDPLIKGQKIGKILSSDNPPFLHFGVGDGIGVGIGQTINLENVFSQFPEVGERASGTSPGIQDFTADEIAYVVQNTDLPLDPNYCNWIQLFGSPIHDGDEYYGVDMICDGSCPAKEANGADVYCACGGCDITSSVLNVSGSTVTVIHQNISFMSFAFNYSFVPRIIACESGFCPTLSSQIDEIKGVPSLLKVNVAGLDSVNLVFNKHNDCWEYTGKIKEQMVRFELTKDWVFSLKIKGRKNKFSLALNKPTGPIYVKVDKDFLKEII